MLFLFRMFGSFTQSCQAITSAISCCSNYSRVSMEPLASLF